MSKQLVDLFCAQLAATAPHQAKADMPGSIMVVDDLAELPLFACLEKPDLPQGGDIVVYPDYSNDGLTPQEAEELAEWFFNAWEAVLAFMSGLGYCQLGENDGSGNGLFYAALYFRPHSRYPQPLPR